MKLRAIDELHYGEERINIGEGMSKCDCSTPSLQGAHLVLVLFMEIWRDVKSMCMTRIE